MKARKPLASPGSLGFGILGVGCIALLLLYADGAVEAVKKGLQLCHDTVIPALFPFMVASELLVGCGGAAAIGRVLARPFRAVLGVPGAAACPIVLGALCGFPTGARVMAALYDRGELSARQCTRLLTFINLPSSAYLISAVGASLLGSRRMGVVLWSISLLCAGLTALLTRVLLRDDAPDAQQAPQPVRMGAGVFTSAVSTAAQSMLAVCAYVLFFSAVLGALQSAAAGVSLSPVLHALVYGLLELSGGMARAAAIPNATQAAMVCAALGGWSGLSVMCQIMTVCQGRGFSFVPYLLAKLGQAILAAALTGLVARYLLPLLPPEHVHAGVWLPESTASVLIRAANIGFVTCFGMGLVRKIKGLRKR